MLVAQIEMNFSSDVPIHVQGSLLYKARVDNFLDCITNYSMS